MTGSMYAAIAGLRTHMQNLNVIGNNIANVNTAGYKSARAVFRTSIYTTLTGGSNGTSSLGGVNPSQIGYGANVGTIDIDMSTGNYSITGKPTDCMIDGEGFFLVGTKDIPQNFKGTVDDLSLYSSLTLTRVGDFDFMPDGYLAKNDGGEVVYGFLCIGVATKEDVIAGKAKKEGQALFSDQLVPIRVPRVWRDDGGAMHVGYPRAGGGIQDEVLDADGKTVLVPGDTNEEFQKKYDANADTEYNHLLDYGAYFDKATKDVVESDYELGYFQNITINPNTGVITATCRDLDNAVITIGCLAVGTVTNPNGVTQIGNSMYRAGEGSGELRISALGGAGEDMGIYYVNGSLVYTPENPGTDFVPGMVNMTKTYENAIDGARLLSGDAKILTNGLEMSKTDLAQEIANMILTQRGYQANTRVITVTDSMLEELVNMKR